MPARLGPGEILCRIIRRRAPNHRDHAIAEDVVYDAGGLTEGPAAIGDRQIDCRPWLGLALITDPHAIAVLPPAIEEAEAISPATHRARTVFAGQELGVDSERRQDLQPVAARTFLG